ncbi:MULTISPECIES: lysoplasmalogenase [unclassified Pseudomonas]|uniref:lysoplasmalogenase n=1 Tax=unclassified Pseudomonas TaxID=196821 RepID=UPI002446C862|nr:MULTISPECIES: lysoplasmalogenase [unclassified Pseudomonas]MDG9922694.1 lysoplasmalogenase [Pseudomonas sp. GD04045]MDH0033173.1 lysoplasmalogenase [Pseudomonas sp. GD04019]
MRPLLLILALAGVALFLLGLHLEFQWLTLLSKPVPMICLLIWLRQAPAGTYRRWIAIGLGFSLLGDMLLQWSADLFVFGLGAFLLAHLAYLVAYLSDTRRLAPLDLLIAALAAGGMFFVLAGAGLGPLLLPVALYSLAIGAMLWRALARIGAVAATSAWLAAGGAALFVLSDSLIGINRFVAPFEGAGYAIILSYWLGQLGITASAVVLLARPAQLEGASSAPSISRR